jgi:1-acyl-sn-glycerol-3-phosphate acyltransferase
MSQNGRRLAAPVEQTPLLLRLPVLGGPAERVDRYLRGWRDHGHVGNIGERDPEYVERALRWLAPIVDFWFRGEVRHMDRIPRTGPVLLVANHSGGLVTPDTWVFEVNYIRHFGTTRETYALAHDMVMGMPLIGRYLRASGALPADHHYAENALHRGAAVLVYPGGDEDVFRPFTERNKVHLAGRTGFIRLALRTGVPIIPLVSVGGHETVLVLGDGLHLAQRLGLDKRFRLKTLPIVVGPPWGISPGDWLFHIPLPAKVTVECGRPIDLRAHFGPVDPEDRDAVWQCYRYVERRMQSILDRLAAERRLPILG